MITESIRLKDKDFFCNTLDSSIQELGVIKDVVIQTQNYQKARRLFATYIRENLQPQRYLSIPYTMEDNAFLYVDEEELGSANRMTRLELISTGTPYQFEDEVDWEFNPTDNQYKEWTWQLNRHNEFRVLAHQYQLTGNEIYAKTFTRLFKSWVNQAIVPDEATSYETKCWRTIEAGLRIYNWMYALHAFIDSPEIEDDILVDFYKSLWEHGWRLRNFHATNNWLIMEMNGLCQIGVICPVFKEAKEWKEYALDTLKKELEIQVYPDGFQCELSTGYHHVVVVNYFRVLEVLRAYEEAIPEKFLGELEKAIDVYLKLVMPNGLLPDINDGKWANVGELLEPVLPYDPHKEEWKWYISKGQKGIEPLYHTEILPYSGFGVLRDKQGEKSYYGLLDAAPFGCGHQHEDKLNFIMNCYGKTLITEGGNYAYDESEMRRYVLSTRAHNTIRIDGMDQNRRQNYKWHADQINQLADMTWACDEKIDWVEGSYKEGYGPDAQINVVHKRKVLFMKDVNGLDPFFVVIDRVIPTKSSLHKYEILWHLGVKEITKCSLGITSLDEDGKNIFIQAAYQPGLNLEIIKGQEQPEFQGWLPYNNGLQGEYEPSPTLSYTCQAKGAIRIVTLCYPLYHTECQVKNIEASNNIEDIGIKLILKNNQVIEITE